MADRSATATATIVQPRLSEDGPTAGPATSSRGCGDIVLRHGGRLVTPAATGSRPCSMRRRRAVRAAVAMQRPGACGRAELSGARRRGRRRRHVGGRRLLRRCRSSPQPACEAAAGAGQILVSHAVRLLAGDRAGDRYEHVGPLDLPGLAEPVDAYLVGWDDPAATSVAEVAVAPPMPLALGATADPSVRRAHRGDGRAPARRGSPRRGGERPDRPGRRRGRAPGKTRLAIELARRVPRRRRGRAATAGATTSSPCPTSPGCRRSTRLLPALPARSSSSGSGRGWPRSPSCSPASNGS